MAEEKEEEETPEISYQDRVVFLIAAASHVLSVSMVGLTPDDHFKRAREFMAAAERHMPGISASFDD